MRQRFLQEGLSQLQQDTKERDGRLFTGVLKWSLKCELFVFYDTYNTFQDFKHKV